VPVRSSHDVEHVLHVFERNVLVEQIAHRIHEDPARRAESGEKTAYEVAKSDEEAADKVAESWVSNCRSRTPPRRHDERIKTAREPRILASQASQPSHLGVQASVGVTTVTVVTREWRHSLIALTCGGDYSDLVLR
jgi:hypothetical protein